MSTFSLLHEPIPTKVRSLGIGKLNRKVCKYPVNKHTLHGIATNLLQSREQYIVILQFSFDFSGCLTMRVINAARIVLFKSRINCQAMFNDQYIKYIDRLR